MTENINVPANETITIPFSRPSMTHKCIICKAKSPLVVVPSLAKLRVFVKRGLIIHGKARCCKRHLKGSFFNVTDSNRIEAVSDTSTLSASQITDLLNDLRACVQRGFLDFENPGALSDIDYHRLTGISGANFDNLFSYVKSKIRSTLARSARTCIAILLMKLRTGLSHSILSTLFGLP